MENGQILQDITFLIENYQNDYYNMEDMKGLLYDAVNEILEMAVSHGFEGDLWLRKIWICHTFFFPVSHLKIIFQRKPGCNIRKYRLHDG